MKTIFLTIVALVLTISCGKEDPSLLKKNLGGYWEIESVTWPDGSKKDFSFSSSVDFIDVSEEKGIRIKVMPQIDGSFINNGPSEKFTIKIEDDRLQLYYETPYDNWKETVLKANESVLKVINKDGKIYSYKKYEKFKFKE